MLTGDIQFPWYVENQLHVILKEADFIVWHICSELELEAALFHIICLGEKCGYKVI